MTHIQEIASKLGLRADDLELYGSQIAKVNPDVLTRGDGRKGSRLVLVSAITPTPAGEGKTTTSIGLAQGLSRLGESVCVALREPSLGPCFGRKGGGAGGGKSEVLPTDRINLHFTGDFHAVSSAHNLLAAIVDNHLYFDNRLRIDPRRVGWKRVLDVNDRALRDIVIGLGGRSEGVPRESGFDITAASEVMAMLCLAENTRDLRSRIDRTLVGYSSDGEPVTARALAATGAMLALLRDALKPNLVGTTEGVPAFVHGGPFANIAHGCSSVVATKMALHLSDWAITEAGFGFDLGAEKFFDIKCRSAGLRAAAVVLVATVRALKMHGGKKLSELLRPDPAAVERGLPNLEKHLENIACFCPTPIVALNRFTDDTDAEISVVCRRCESLGVAFSETNHFLQGGAGAEQLAQTVIENVSNVAGNVSGETATLYDLSATVQEKIEAVATRMYGADDVAYTKVAMRQLREIERLGYGNLPICMAKTPSSLSDDPKQRGRPRGFGITVHAMDVNAGAGFIVVLTGEVIRMPGLPRDPRAAEIDLVEGRITGLD